MQLEWPVKYQYYYKNVRVVDVVAVNAFMGAVFVERCSAQFVY